MPRAEQCGTGDRGKPRRQRDHHDALANRRQLVAAYRLQQIAYFEFNLGSGWNSLTIAGGDSLVRSMSGVTSLTLTGGGNIDLGGNTYYVQTVNADGSSSVTDGTLAALSALVAGGTWNVSGTVTVSGTATVAADGNLQVAGQFQAGDLAVTGSSDFLAGSKGSLRGNCPGAARWSRTPKDWRSAVGRRGRGPFPASSPEPAACQERQRPAGAQRRKHLHGQHGGRWRHADRQQSEQFARRSRISWSGPKAVFPSTRRSS